jgi:hypothetical protein
LALTFVPHILVRFAESLISSYFNIVRKNFMDLVPKTIMCFLVNQTKGVCGCPPPPPGTPAAQLGA